MNLVLDDAEEVHMKTKNRKPLGKNCRSDFSCTKMFITCHFKLSVFALHQGGSC